MDQSLAFMFGLLGNIVSFMVFLAPLPTFYQIYKKRSTQGFQSIPYIVGLFSAMLWIYYAFLKPDTTLLITINSLGCFIQSAYICFYLVFATRNARVETVKLLIVVNVVGFGLVMFATQFYADDSNKAEIVGWICLVFSVCVFVAPLCVVGQVIRTKSVEYMPFLPSFFLTLSAVMWFFYGLLRKDYNIGIPNVVGFSFGLLQMVVYLIYRNKKIHEIEIEIEIEIEEDKIAELKEHIIDVVKMQGRVDVEIKLGGDKPTGPET